MAFRKGLIYHPMIEPVQGKPVGKKPTEQISNLIILFPCNLHESSQVGKAAVVWVINVPICSCIWALGFQLPVFFVKLWRWKLAGGSMSLRLGWELQPCRTSNLLSLLCIYGTRCDLLASCSCHHAWLLLSCFPSGMYSPSERTSQNKLFFSWVALVHSILSKQVKNN